MHSSRPFLYKLYSKYVRRACENLGVSPEEDNSDEESTGMLRDEDYPSEFYRVTDVDRQETMNSLTGDPEFMKQFGKYL